MEEFDFAYNPKLPAATIRDLATLRFVDVGESVILHGPVGVGKTHIAQALGHLAFRHGPPSCSPRPAGCSPTSPAATPTAPGHRASAGPDPTS